MSNADEIKKIERELAKKWNQQEDKGFMRLSKAYRFFTDVRDDNGEMVFHDLCAHTIDMRMGSDGKAEFQRFVNKRVDLTQRCYENNSLDQIATDAANEYFTEQAHRLASYIVRIKDMDVTDDYGNVVNDLPLAHRRPCSK